MPNYCDNDLKIMGDGKDAFLEFAKEPDGESLFDFNQFIPYPEPFKSMDDESSNWKGFNSGGYHWCIENWGTKWNAGDVRLGDHDTWESNLHFTTAWEPPLPVILAASKKFPCLDFELVYYEKGMEFHGIFRAKAGEVLESWRGRYVGNRGG